MQAGGFRRFGFLMPSGCERRRRMLLAGLGPQRISKADRQAGPHQTARRLYAGHLGLPKPRRLHLSTAAPPRPRSAVWSPHLAAAFGGASLPSTHRTLSLTVTVTEKWELLY